jgi:hypothetical protein
MVSHWHSGLPLSSARLVWPSGDATIQGGRWELQGISTLMTTMDGLVLYWLPFSMPNRTLIYLADTRKQNEQGEVVILKVTELECFAHCTVLLENRSGFVTAEWMNECVDFSAGRVIY